LNIICPLCRSTRARIRFGAINECSDCGFIFAALEHYVPSAIYNQNYFTGTVYRDYMGERHIRMRIFREKLKLIAPYIPPRGRLLDIGCAAGFFLQLMNGIGYETYGVEVSEHAARYAQQEMGLDVFRGDLSEADFQHDFFDVITMWDVLEHLPDFLTTLKECNRILSRQGRLVVETVNADSLLARILGRRWPLFAPPYHLSYFTKESLKKALEVSGFAIINIIPIQTYALTFGGSKPLKYFTHPFLRASLGRLLDDVVLVVSSPVRDEAAERTKLPK
jgi:2-polyprenyl-3-methyl-5-hydroxy-6-metoxy-1,4-benzoquinol methylase